MELVAHCNRLCDQRVECQTVVHGAERSAEYRTQNVSHPAQTVDNFLGVRAEAEYLADALVHGAVCTVSVGLVLDDKDSHVRGGDAAHRADCVDVVARNELDLAVLEHLSCVSLVVCPLLEQNSAYAGALHRVRHVLICYRRTCMEDYLALAHFRNDFLGTDVVLQDRLACDNLCDDLAVLLVDVLAASQEVQGLDQLDIASCRRHPVVLYDLAAELLADLSEALQTDVDDLRLLGQHLHQLVGRLVLLDLDNLLRTNRLLRLSKVSADRADCGLACQLVVLADDNAGILQLVDCLVVALIVSAGAADGSDEEYLSVCCGSLSLQLLDGRQQCAGHVGMRAVAQHDVQQDNAGGLVIHSFLHALDALCRIDHRMRLALGVCVVAEVNNDVAVELEHIALNIFRRIGDVHRVLDQHRCFVCQRAAGVVCLDGLVVLSLVELGLVDVDGGFRNFLAANQADCQTGSLIQRVGVIEVLLVILRLLAQEQGDDRLGEAAQTGRDLLAHCLCRRLGDDDQNLDGLILLHRVDHIHHRDAADRSGQVASAGADCVVDALAQTVNDGGQLLDAGAGSADDADGALGYAVGECDRNTLDDAGTAVRPHNRQALSVRLLLECLLVLNRDVIAEHEYVQTLIQCAVCLKSSVCARNGNDCEVCVRQLVQRLVPGLDALGALGCVVRSGLLLEELLDVLHDGVEQAVVVDVRNNYHVVCGSSHQLFSIQTALLKDILVCRGRHHDGNLLDAFDRRDLIGQEHEYNGILIASLFYYGS